MTTTMRRRILRANALWLVVAAGGGLLADVLGAFFARGPQRIIAVEPHTGVGFNILILCAMRLNIHKWSTPAAVSLRPHTSFNARNRRSTRFHTATAAVVDATRLPMM